LSPNLSISKYEPHKGLDSGEHRYMWSSAHYDVTLLRLASLHSSRELIGFYYQRTTVSGCPSNSAYSSSFEFEGRLVRSSWRHKFSADVLGDCSNSRDLPCGFLMHMNLSSRTRLRSYRTLVLRHALTYVRTARAEGFGSCASDYPAGGSVLPKGSRFLPRIDPLQVRSLRILAISIRI